MASPPWWIVMLPSVQHRASTSIPRREMRYAESSGAFLRMCAHFVLDAIGTDFQRRCSLADENRFSATKSASQAFSPPSSVVSLSTKEFLPHFWRWAVILTSSPVKRTLLVQGFRPCLMMVTSCQQHVRSISEGVPPTKAPSTWMSAPAGVELICACMSAAVGDHRDASSTRSSVETADR